MTKSTKTQMFYIDFGLDQFLTALIFLFFIFANKTSFNLQLLLSTILLSQTFITFKTSTLDDLVLNLF